MVGLQNLFVDVSIKISISRATRLFYFLGNSCPVFLPLSRGVTVSWAEKPARLMSKGGKLFLLSNMQVGVLPPHHPCNLQQLRCPSDENV